MMKSDPRSAEGAPDSAARRYEREYGRIRRAKQRRTAQRNKTRKAKR